MKSKKKLPKCSICGNEEGVKKVKLPHGSFNICTGMTCLDKLNYMIGGTIPIVWFSMDAFVNHDEATEEIAKPLLGDFSIAKILSDEVESCIWAGETFGEMFHDALDESLGTLEKLYVEHLKDAELPLINIDSLKSEEARTLLETRLKGGKHGA